VLKNIFVIVVCLSAALFAANEAHAWEFSFDNYPAYAIYEENADVSGVNVSSDWKAFYYKGVLSLSKYDNENFQGEIHCGMGVGSKSTETWDLNDSQVQTNDMSFWNMDTEALIGWAFATPTPTVDAPHGFKFVITPLIGYGWRFDRFTRQNFHAFGAVNMTDIVDEDYNIQSADLGGRISINYEKVTFYVKPIFGIVVYNSANNNELGTVKGDGGFLFNFDAGIDYSLTQNIILGAAFKMELQDLNGATKDNVVWPDNLLQTYGGTISVRGKF